MSSSQKRHLKIFNHIMENSDKKSKRPKTMTLSKKPFNNDHKINNSRSIQSSSGQNAIPGPK